jgi:hypothetical protein
MSSRMSILKSLVVILPIMIVLSSSNNWDKTLKELTTGSYEYKACKLIIYKESRYNPKAVNGSHYGLAQGRSKYLKTATPQQQIKWFTKYVYSRYGTCRAALAFHLKHGYY